MGWLAGPAIAAAMVSLLAVYLYNHVIVGPHGILSSIAKVGIFVGSFTFVATYSLLHSFDEHTRWLTHRGKEVGKRPKFLSKIKFW